MVRNDIILTPCLNVKTWFHCFIDGLSINGGIRLLTKSSKPVWKHKNEIFDPVFAFFSVCLKASTFTNAHDCFSVASENQGKIC